MAEETSVEGQEELLVFDSEDLINGIGGALGLFLGWSILYLGKARDKEVFFLLDYPFLNTGKRVVSWTKSLYFSVQPWGAMKLYQHCMTNS